MTAKVTQPVHIEKKVVAATVGAALASGGVYVLQNDQSIVAHLHGTPATLVAILAGPLLTALLAYRAKHSVRADLLELASEAGLGSLTDPSAAVAVADPAN